MNSDGQAWTGLRGWLGVLLIGVAPLPAGGEGPCNPTRFEKRVQTDDGYKERRSSPDPYCEGEFNEPVAGHRQAGIVVCEYSVGPRPLSWKDGDEWRISWPARSGRSLIHGCHRDLSKQYEIDGEKTAPARPAAEAPAQFTWLTRLAKAKGFNTTDVQFRVDVPNTARVDGKTEWPELPPQTNVFVPARISAVAPQPATKPAVNPVAKPADPKPPRLRVCIAANKTTKIKSASATRVGGKDEKVDIESWAHRTLERAALPFDLQLPHDGAVWRIEVLLEDSKDRVTPAVPFYVQAPPAAFVNSPAN